MSDELIERRKHDFTAEEIRRFDHAWKSDVDLKLDRLDRRTLIIERLIWIAVGAISILATVGTAVLGIGYKQSIRLDTVVEKQATDSARITSLERDVNRLHSQPEIARPKK